jgi:hypothetical protein
MKDKLLGSKFWKYLPRPNVIVQETDGFNEDLPLIFIDHYIKSNCDKTTSPSQINLQNLKLDDLQLMNPAKVNCNKVETFLKERHNPNDAEFEKEELRISHLATFQPRSQSFLAQRSKNTSMLNIQGENCSISRKSFIC